MASLREVIRTALENFGASVVEEVKQSIASTDPLGYGPMVATKQAMESIRFLVEEGRVRIYSTMPGVSVNYILTLEHGRGPGKMPPVINIKNWMQIKNIRPADISEDSLAFLIARKIGREGSALYRAGGNSGILFDVLRDDTLFDRLLYLPLREAFKEYAQNEIR